MNKRVKRLDAAPLLDRVAAWLEKTPHKKWCNVAPENIYTSDGKPCDCEKDEIQAALNTVRGSIFGNRKNQP